MLVKVREILVNFKGPRDVGQGPRDLGQKRSERSGSTVMVATDLSDLLKSERCWSRSER